MKHGVRDCLPCCAVAGLASPSLTSVISLLLHILPATAAYKGDFSMFGNIQKQERKTNIPT